MNLFDGILTRRSIRSFKKKSIDDAIISDLLKAAVSAPSAGNQQPWHFIVLSDKKVLEQVSCFLPNGKMLADADKGICVCGDLSAEKYKGYWMVDCSAATQNILLAAHHFGIGSCWLGVYPRENRVKNLSQFFKTPKYIVPFSVVALGYSDELGGCVDDRLSLLRIHYNCW